MGFEVPAHRVTIDLPISDAEEVKRRTFVAGTGVLAAAGLLPTRPGPRIGVTDIDHLRMRLDGLYGTDHSTGSVPAMTQATRIEVEITQALESARYTAPIGRHLQAMLAELHGDQAWYYYDGCQVAAGRARCMEAFSGAQLIDDPLLQISALETLVLLAVKDGRAWEAQCAVEHAYRLAQRAGAVPAVHVVVALRDANTATHTGDLAKARRALNRAMAHHARVDNDPDVPRWARFIGPFEIDLATADMYLRAGRPMRAVPFLRAAVRGIGGDLPRNSAKYRVKLARVLLDAGELEEACKEMDTALDACAQIASPRLVTKMREFDKAAARFDSLMAAECRERVRHAIQRGPRGAG
ncbi:hypothetical protein [Spongiactinospora sp. 9N601]|uniref:hypothetical protein n=1 Tax=Spongiactinospora sp. 9N601 TaxID=3375149 RepID=UPI0037A6DBC5